MNKSQKKRDFFCCNFFPKNSRGQFYLLAAIVIIVIIAGFAAVSNYAQKKTSVKLYDVKDELGIESGKVLDYGTLKGDRIDTDGDGIADTDIIEHFTDQYDKYAGEDKEIFFIFGNYEEVVLITYADISPGTIEIVAGETKAEYDVPGREIIKEVITPTESGEVSIKIEENVYDFILKPGENFYFVISQTIGEEEIVVVS
jgi:hypothetical protein